MTSPVTALAADHAGFELKNAIKVVLEEHGFPVVDLGPATADPVDYPDMAGKLAAALGRPEGPAGDRASGRDQPPPRTQALEPRLLLRARPPG